MIIEGRKKNPSHCFCPAGLELLQRFAILYTPIVLLDPGLLDPLVDLRVVAFLYTLLAEIPDDFFKYNRMIVSINLSYNRITHLPIGILNGLSGLTEFHIEGNSLDRLDPGLFFDTPSLRNFYLNNNMWAGKFEFPELLLGRMSNMDEISILGNGAEVIPSLENCTATRLLRLQVHSTF